METEHEDEWELIDDVDADWEKVTSEADAKTARMKTFAEALAQPSATAAPPARKLKPLATRTTRPAQWRGPPSPTRSRRDRLTGSERLPRWSDVAFVSQ
jgi:hypothetical protein